MKQKIYLLAALCLYGISTFAQAPNWEWATGTGGNNLDKANSVTTDAAGNIYITGGFNSPSVTFGSTTVNNAPASGSVQFFIAKYDASGNAIWAKSAGGIGPDEGNNITTDNSGNVYVTGYFQSDTIIFDTDTLVNAKTDYSSDIFIVKYDASGNVLWAKRSGGNRFDYGHGIGTDSNGNVYLSGRFASDSISFDSYTLVNRNITSSVAGLDLFIVKLDANGNTQWAKKAGGVCNDAALNIAVDASNNIFVTGTFGSDSLHLGAFTLANTHDSTLNYGNIFLAKYTTSGNVVWATSAGGIYSEEPNGIKTDAAGNIFVTGRFFSKTFPVGSTTLTNADTSGTYMDMFLIKFDPSGSVLWARKAGGTDQDEGMAATTDSDGNVYITGYYLSNTCTFGTTTLTNTGSSFTDNIFLAKYDASGNLIYAYTPAGNSNDEGRGITTDTWDNVYMTGFYRSLNTVFGTTTLPQAGYGDIFLSKLLPVSVGIRETANENGITIYPNPTSNLFTVALPDDAKEIRVCNSLGQVIKTDLTEGNKIFSYEVNENGIYFVKVTTGKGMITKKLIVCR